MEKQKCTEQSSLTSQKSFPWIKENTNETKTKSGNEHSDVQEEYSFMDGVLGCVKV